METVSKENLSWNKRMRIPLNFGRFFSGNVVSPIISHGEESWDRIVCLPQRGLSGFRELYEDIGSFEFEEAFSEKTLEGQLLDPVIAELYEQYTLERVFKAYFSSNSSVTEDRILLVIDFPEQDKQFSPDFVEIQKWVTHIISGSYSRIREDISQEQTEILLEYALPDVLREIQKENLQDAISSAITISREVFRNLHGINIGIAYDPEIPGRKTFRMVLIVSGNPVDVLDDERKFKKQLYSILDARGREKITITYRWENK